MWELFAALFGGAYIAGRVGSEKAATKASNRRRETYRDINNQITNIALEDKMRSEMHWGKPYDTDRWHTTKAAIKKMESEVPERDMEYVFGGNWRDLFNNKFTPYIVYDGLNGGFNCIHEVAFNLWLANKHLISTNHTSGYVIECRMKDVDHALSRGIALRACEVIESHIQETHPELRLYYHDGTSEMSYNNGNLTYRRLEWSHWLDNLQARENSVPLVNNYKK